MTRIAATPLLSLVLLAGCAKPKQVTVEELAIKITVPGDWERSLRNGGIAYSAGLDGVILRSGKEMLASIDDARKTLIQGAKIREEKTLPSGAFYFDYTVDYGTPTTPMVLRHIEVLLPNAKGHVQCTLQLQASQDADPIAKACSSMQSL